MGDLFMLHHKDGTKMYYVGIEEIESLIERMKIQETVQRGDVFAEHCQTTRFWRKELEKITQRG